MTLNLLPDCSDFHILHPKDGNSACFTDSDRLETAVSSARLPVGKDGVNGVHYYRWSSRPHRRLE